MHTIDESSDVPDHQRRFAGVNDIMMRCALTGFHFTWVGICLTFVMRRNWTSYAVPLIILLTIGITSLLSYPTWKRHAISEKKEQRFSMLAGAYWGYLLALIYFYIAPHQFFRHLPLLILLPLIGRIIGSNFSIYGCPTLWKRFVCFIMLWIFATLPLLFCLFVLCLSFR